jgi:uncharacterized membrane protein
VTITNPAVAPQRISRDEAIGDEEPGDVDGGQMDGGRGRESLNDVIAAALTRWVGSMPTVYLALVVIGGWMVLGGWTWGPLHRLDPYPFRLMLFINNIVQLVLCLVILVGQRVLGGAADRRAEDTYDHAEAIFAEVVELQYHLDRHDRALSQGISLLQSRPHPWIEQHHIRRPTRARGRDVSLNGRIGAWLTERLGSMWTFYAAGATQFLWIGLWALKVQHVDPYPFAFMTFLSTLAQLVIMLVIMVGQEVLGRDGDRRAVQTFHDAEAILHECRRMRARLSAQDRIIISLCDYTSGQLIERLARAVHRSYLEAALQTAVVDRSPASGAALRDWDELPEDLKESNRAQARNIGEKLATLGCFMVPAIEGAPAFVFEEAEVQLLARAEHDRWMAERIAQGYRYGPVRTGTFHPDLVPWEELSEQARAKDVRTVRAIPALLAGEGFQALRIGDLGAVGP